MYQHTISTAVFLSLTLFQGHLLTSGIWGTEEKEVLLIFGVQVYPINVL